MCTAGRCRSPIAAALLAKRLDHIGSGLSISSVGLKFTGEPTPETGVSLMAERGIDLAHHRSAPVTEEIIEEADLILGMTREHVQEIVGLSPGALSKTFTLKDFVRRAKKVGPPRRHQRWEDWLTSVGQGRKPRDVLGSNPDDEVPDPYGQRVKVWQRTIDELDELVSPIPRLLGIVEYPAPSQRTLPAADVAEWRRRANVAR